MVDFSIRPARRGDAADLAILDNIAGHGISYWFWQGAVKMGKAEDAFEWGRMRLADDDALFGWTNSSIAEDSDTTLGAVNSYLMPPPDPNDEKSNPPQFKPVMELFGVAAGDWLVDSLAVYAAARGRGVGSALLDHSIKQAQEASVARISLVVEDSNTPALALYQSRKFEERERRAFVSFSQVSKTENWLLLTADLT